MTSEKFIAIIRQVVRGSAIQNILDNLGNPPGRGVSDTEQLRSNWFNSLPSHDREMVDSIVSDAVDEAIFGLLTVIDGSRSIESGDNKGNLELIYRGEDDKLLTDPNAIGLHDLYNSNV